MKFDSKSIQYLYEMSEITVKSLGQADLMVGQIQFRMDFTGGQAT